MPTLNDTTPSLLDKLQSICSFVWKILAVGAGLTIVVMILSTSIDATARYVFNRPISGVFELNEAILVICVYLGLAWTQEHRGHIRVTVFHRRFSPRSVVWLDLVAWTLNFVFVIILVVQTSQGALESIESWEFRWGSVQMPIWWVKCLIPLGFATLAIQLFLDICKEIGKLRGDFLSEHPDAGAEVEKILKSNL